MMERRYSRVSELRRRRLFLWFVAALAIWSLSVAFMPLANGLKESTPIPMYVDGAVFWLGLLSTLIITIIINRRRIRSPIFNQLKSVRKRLGLIHFFQSIEAMIFDITMFLSIIGFILVKLFSDSLQLAFIFLAVFIFSFGMHCMLNGTNYQYINYKVRRDIES